MSSKFLPNTWDVIERVGTTLGLDDTQLADMLQFTAKELEKHRREKKILSADKIFSLSDRLNVGFDRIVTGNIDYQALSQHYSGNQNFLPERYALAAFSRRRTTAFILNFIESMFGWKERLIILRHFQLNEAMFSNLDLPISFLFSSDLCEYLQRYKLGDRALSQMGVQSFLSSNTHQVKEELRDCADAGEIYERMCDSLIAKYFEKNFIYKIEKMNETSCTVSAKPSALLTETLDVKTIGNSATAIVRTGIAAAYPTILGLPPSIVKQSKCIYSGDDKIQYEIDFSRAAEVMSKPIWN